MDMQEIRDRYRLSPSPHFSKPKLGSTLRYEVPGRRTIPATFALFLILIMVLGGVAIHNMSEIKAIFTDTVTIHGKKLQLLDRLLRAIQSRQLIIDNIILAGNPFEKNHIRLREEIQTVIDDLRKMPLDQQEQSWIQSINMALHEIYQIQDQALEQALMANPSKAYQLIQREIHPKIEEVQAQLLLLRRQQDYITQTAYDNAQAAIRRSQEFFLVLCAMAIIFGGSIAFYVLRKVQWAFNGYYNSLNTVYAELENSNYALNLENRERKRAEAQLRKHRDELENRVLERTAELQEEIKMRAQTEYQLRISKERAEQASHDLGLKNVELIRSLQSLKLFQQKVNERTQALQHANIQLQNEITERQVIEQRLRETQQQMVDIAHRAGMSEIITGVLHNVGNILNTVKTSSDMIQEALEKTKLPALTKANTLLKSQEERLGEFFTADPRAKPLYQYYITVGDQLDEEHQQLKQHSQHLQNAVAMMSDIITAQQNYAKVGLLTEALQLAVLVEDALQLQANSLNRRGIQIRKNFQMVPAVFVQRIKMLEVIINILKNAKEAMHNSLPPRQLTLEILAQDDKVLLRITDSGEGIAPENLARIFSHGFTTKDSGHGFGLHASANAMAEMGGSLTASSQGIGRGATFTLTCPTRLSVDPHATQLP